MRVVVAAAVAACVTAVCATAGVPVIAPPLEAAHASIVVTPTGGFGARVPMLLEAISALSPGAVPEFITRHSAEIAATLSTPSAARQVGGWWHSLPQSAHSTLEKRAPALLGNLNGVPLKVRGTINRARLQLRLDTLEARSRSTTRSASASVQSQLAGLRSIETALRAKAGSAARTLTTFEPSGSMRAAIAIGAIETADDVSFLVPGMFYTVADQMSDWTETAQQLYDAQRRWLARLSQPSRSVAVVAWLGYHTPDLRSVLSLDDARAGAKRLAGALAGVRAVRAKDQPYLSVVAHSYGSTTALLALHQKTVEVDALAVVGTPGSPATSVRELDVKSGRVYVGSAIFDPIAGSGYFGVDPGNPHYGAHRFGVAGGIDPIDGRLMLPAIGHNGYFAPGTESMRNLALIALGDGVLTT